MIRAHDVDIERGRYDKKPTEPEERCCKYCRTKNLAVEDEFHFLMVCPLYMTERIIMLTKIYDLFPNTKMIDLINQLFWLMCQENTSCLNENAKFITESMNKRKKTLDSVLANKNIF